MKEQPSAPIESTQHYRLPDQTEITPELQERILGNWGIDINSPTITPSEIQMLANFTQYDASTVMMDFVNRLQEKQSDTIRQDGQPES